MILGTSDYRRGGDVINVLFMFLHPNYKTKQKPFDAAILFMGREPKFSQFPIKVNEIFQSLLLIVKV